MNKVKLSIDTNVSKIDIQDKLDKLVEIINNCYMDSTI